jgi:hypothetical protein
MTRRYTMGSHPARCVYCGETRPRVIVARGKAHRRCIPADGSARSLDDLTKPQQRALIDMLSKGGLYSNEAGWHGVHTHRRLTINALERLGLCSFTTIGTCHPTWLAVDMVERDRDRVNAAVRSGGCA